MDLTEDIKEEYMIIKWIDPVSLELSRQSKGLPDGAVVIAVSTYEDENDIKRYQSHYLSVVKGDLQSSDKRETSEKLLKQAVTYMIDTGRWPPYMKVIQYYKNGRAKLSFKPDDYSDFKLAFPSEIGSTPLKMFLESLDEAEEIVKRDYIWKIEHAKSSRSKCKSCQQKITKDEVRLGRPYYYQDHLAHAWYHVNCAAKKKFKLRKNEGLDDLTASEKAELKKLGLI